MAYPSYVPTRVVTFGGAMSLESSELLKVRMTVVSSRSLVWAASGYRFEALGSQETSSDGAEVSMVLPRTDVQGWRDGRTNQPIDVSAPDSYTHQYVAKIDFLDARGFKTSTMQIGPFVVPDGEGPIDLDLTVPASTVAGGQITIPDEWSAQLAAAAAYAADAAASAADSIPTAQKAAPLGVAPLDADSRVPDGNLPSRLGASELSAAFASAAQGAKADNAVPNTPAGRAALAATTELTSAFASAAQGAKADNAVPNTPAGRAALAATTELTTAIVSAVAGRQYGRRWVYDGDSITIGNITTNAENQDRAGSWTVDMAGRSQGRIHYVYNAGLGGQTIAGALTRFDTYVAPYTPDVVMLSIGTNDISQGRTLIAFLADLDTYWAECTALGADLVLGEIYPKSTTQATIATWNAAIREWAEPKGIHVVPFSMLGKADGSWPDGWSADGTHPLVTGPSLSEIGRLAWEYLEPYCGPAFPSGVYGGANLATNGFLTSETSAPFSAVTAALAATTGTLPAGTYEYRVLGATHFTRGSGKHSDASITLGAPGGVTLTRTATGAYTLWLIFRRDPTSTEFKFLAAVSGGTATWTDDGTVTPLWSWQDDTLSTYPTGWGINSGAPYSLAYGSRLREVDGVRGKVLRAQCAVRGDAAWENFFEVTGLTAGQTLEVSMLVRGPVAPPSGKVGKLFLRWRSSGAGMGNTILLEQWIDSQWRRITFTAKVPAGADRVLLGIAGDDTWPYLDVAEISIV